MTDAIPLESPEVLAMIRTDVAEAESRLRDAYGTRGPVRWSDLGALLDSHARLMDLVGSLSKRAEKGE